MNGTRSSGAVSQCFLNRGAFYEPQQHTVVINNGHAKKSMHPKKVSQLVEFGPVADRQGLANHEFVHSL